MQKKCLLLFSRSSVRDGLADPAALCSLLEQAHHGFEVSWAYFDELVFSISNHDIVLYDSHNDARIEAYDSVYLRRWGSEGGHALSVARICRQKDIPFVDNEALQVGSKSKVSQYVNLHEAGIPIPKTLISNGPTLVRLFGVYGFDFPLIMKDREGTRGQNNYLVRSKAEMQAVVDKHPEVVFVLQEFIPNRGDYRVLVAGSKVRLVIERTASGDTHLNNTSQGAKARIVPNDTLPQSVLADCLHAAEFLGRDIAGVDMVKSEADGSYYCFEVNRAPQIEHASFEREKAVLIAEYLYSL